ncbi:unnamed protein product [Bemisia tabaci]|uniref:BEN domain-containing protein n=1 Tax=Bemisia tabaci TaxID=7038 RepID=A0A9P0EXR0_BEMTA|nr:unnamed protein product [Bemisia tabaci]
MAPKKEPAIASVKFLLDGKCTFVPLSYIKNFKSDSFKPNTNYKVFWSPNEDEKPEDVQRNQGIILDLDDEIEARHPRRETPILAGYYNATVLKIADSKEASESLKTKRVSVPTRRVLEGQQMKKDSKRKPKKDSSYVSKEKRKKIVAKTDSLMATKMEEQRKRKEESSTSSSGSGSDDELMTRKKFKEELQKVMIMNDSLKRENKRLTERNIGLETRNEELEAANLRWQDKFFITPSEAELPSKLPCPIKINLVSKDLFSDKTVDKKKEMTKPPATQKRARCTPQKSPVKVCTSPRNVIWSVNTSPISTVHPIHSTPVKHVSQPSCVETAAKANVLKQSEGEGRIEKEEEPKVAGKERKEEPKVAGKELKEEQKEVGEEQREEEKEAGEEQEEEEVEEIDYTLTPRKEKMSYNGVRKGKKGDSLFAKNLATAIFGVDTLVRSSVTGQPAKGGKRKNTTDNTARPALSKAGLKILEDAFERRIKKETPGTGDDELKERKKVIKGAIADRIKYLRAGDS